MHPVRRERRLLTDLSTKTALLRAVFLCSFCVIGCVHYTVNTQPSMNPNGTFPDAVQHLPTRRTCSGQYWCRGRHRCRTSLSNCRVKTPLLLPDALLFANRSIGVRLAQVRTARSAESGASPRHSGGRPRSSAYGERRRLAGRLIRTQASLWFGLWQFRRPCGHGQPFRRSVCHLALGQGRFG